MIGLNGRRRRTTGYAGGFLFRLSLSLPPCVCYNKQARESRKSPDLKAKNSSHTEISMWLLLFCRLSVSNECYILFNTLAHTLYGVRFEGVPMSCTDAWSKSSCWASHTARMSRIPDRYPPSRFWIPGWIDPLSIFIFDQLFNCYEVTFVKSKLQKSPQTFPFIKF